MAATKQDLSREFVLELLDIDISDTESAAESLAKLSKLCDKYNTLGLEPKKDIKDLFTAFTDLTDCSVFNTLNVKLFLGYRFSNDDEFIEHYQTIKTTDYNARLYFACVIDRADIVEAELAKTPDKLNQIYPALKERLGRTPLYLACASKNSKTVNLLLDKGADPNFVSYDCKWGHGTTALHFACAWGNIRLVQVLLKRGANPSASTSKGIAPLWLATLTGNMELVRELLSSKANINQELEVDMDFNKPDSRIRYINLLYDAGETALWRAFVLRNYELAELLLSHGALPDIHPVQRQIPMFCYVIAQGNLEFAKKLFAKGANINFVSKTGETALHAACWNRSYEATKFLLENNANPNVKKYGRTTPLLQAMLFYKGNEDIVLLLLQYGACVTELSKGDKWLREPLESKSKDIAKTLIILGVTSEGLNERQTEKYNALVESIKANLDFGKLIDIKRKYNPDDAKINAELAEILKPCLGFEPSAKLCHTIIKSVPEFILADIPDKPRLRLR